MFTFLVESIPNVQKKMDALNKKGAGMTMTVSAPYLYEINKASAGHVKVTPPEYVQLVDITVTGQLKYGDWTVIASIDHLPGGNVINAHGDVPSYYRTVSSHCDHCHTNRTRNTTVIIRNDITGDYKQIGKNCLAGYIGQDMTAWLYYNQFVEGLSSDEQDRDEYTSEHSKHMGILDALSVATMVADKIGYVSQQKAFENGLTSTASIVNGYLSHRPSSAIQSILDHCNVNESTVIAQVTTTQDMIKWIQENDNNSDYIMNLKAIFDNGEIVLKKHINYALSLVAAYAKAKKDIAEREQKKDSPASQHVGRVGDKLTITGSIKYITSCESQWGYSYLHHITDNNNNVYVWWTNQRYEDKTNCTITATVKGHDEYKGIKQTTVTRCKVK